ncbi:alanine acetyltransferase [Paenibacillus selenitireducens]|uniref:Alanine acetyltransferase n=1 Tax=Paenibacillus selenitireducens TaxID=1324314 RepID=A0A1T2X3Z3_9BACL|nr:GNAT family protein [Paenibacillus selenitireducens]OPA74570.1 alanine acetyltransferase [Paenibacillus selenitireducens]
MRGEHIYLRALEARDAQDLLDLRVRNHNFLQPFEPIRDANYLTLEWQLQDIENHQHGADTDTSHAFGIFLNETDELIGRIAITGISRGPAQHANIGYLLAESQNGKGYMTEAVKMCVSFAFNVLHLHRIQAGVMPRNLRSGRVLEKTGFRPEGLAKRYIRINGVWEDHILFAITTEDLEGQA